MNRRSVDELLEIGLGIFSFLQVCVVVYTLCRLALGPVYGPVLSIAVVLLGTSYEWLAKIVNEENEEEK